MRLKAFPRIAKAPNPPDLAPPAGMTTAEEFQKALEDQASDLSRYLETVQDWQNALIDNLTQREGNIDLAVNGGIEFARPFSTEKNPGANIRMGFRHFMFDNAASSTAAICVDPQYGDGKTPPRGWFVVQVQEVGAVQTSRPILVLDQILSSTNPSPSVTILGYPLARIDASDSRTIRGDNGLVPNGWIGNDVRVGDEICLSKTSAGAGTITTVSGSTAVVGVGTAFLSVGLGQYIRLTTAAGYTEWKQIVGITDDLHLTVNDAFRTAAAGVVYETKVSDREWLGITAVTLGVGTEDILTLNPDRAATVVPKSTTGVQYVIRRPPRTKKLWVRVLSETPNPIAVTLGIF